MAYANELVKALRTGTSTRPRATTSTSKTKKGRKRKADANGLNPSISQPNALQQTPTNWGPLEPLHILLMPVIDMLNPLLTTNSLIGLLLFLLVISWFRNSRLRAQPSGLGAYQHGLSPAERAAAYEEIWKQEEQALWEWLEQRVGMDGESAIPGRRHGDDGKRRPAREATTKGKGMDELEGMNRREVEWAIGVTEEKLRALKAMMKVGNEAADGEA